MQNYSEFVRSLIKDGEEIKRQLTADDCHLIHMSMGLIGETGELLDAIKKHVIYRKPLDFKNVIEELGDIEFYLEGLRSALGLQKERILDHNIKKLSSRYSAGSYSDNQAQDRADKA